jgi:hypothetical protein
LQQQWHLREDRRRAEIASRSNVSGRSWIHPDEMGETFGFVAGSGEGERDVSEPLSFESFFDAEAQTLFRRLCVITGNTAEAEEIMQDAFLALWERWDRVATLDDPTGYLYRTAMNGFRKRRRRASHAVRHSLA